MGRIAFPLLEEAITTRERKTATFAVRILREIDPIRAIDPLVDALSNHDETVRDAALNELVQLGDMVTPRFIQVLSSGNEVAVKLADNALRQMGTAAVPHLVDALADPLSSDPARIASIIRDIGDDAIPYLIPLITPDNPGQNKALTIIKERGISAVPFLLDALGSASPDLNRAIRDNLTGLFEENPGIFIDEMIIRSSGVSQDVIREIISSSPDQVIPHLTRLLSEGDKEKAQLAGELLISFGNMAIEPLITCLREEEDENHKLVITSFLMQMGPAVVPALLEALKDPSLVVYIVAALGSIGEPAVPPLIDLLHDPDEEVVNYAGLSLSRIGLSALPDLLALFKSNKAMIPLISGIIAGMGGVALPYLIEEFQSLESSGAQGSEMGLSMMSMILEISLSDTNQMHALFGIKDEEMLRMLTGILVSKGNVVIDPLISAILTWDKPTPTLVLQTFNSLKSSVLTRVHHVMGQLPDRDLRRIPLIRLLGELRDPSSSAIILDALNDSDRRVRIAAAHELGKLGPEALAPLTRAMQDADVGVRVAAIESMGDLGLPALDQLLLSLKDEEGDIRAAAINGIGKIGEPAKFMLIQALNDSDRQVRKDVVRLLDSFGWEPKYTTDRLSYLFAREDWEMLVHIGPPSTDILARGVKNADPEISEACREALKKIRSSLPP